MINFKKWLKLKEYAFHNYFGPLTGTGVNDEPFSKVGVRSKYIGSAGTFIPDKIENAPDCLYLKKNCNNKRKKK